eukprot:TRINITY_DN24141_c0_g1_i1.p2 TRINITY_DN24141_c0_g1~~TRINITY_DN24141_c0_g1_i1.p2  ORF type:complete len:389 (+),score=52.84 TRINITY_DN24141_c0_g1_i1:2-1168(+)
MGHAATVRAGSLARSAMPFSPRPTCGRSSTVPLGWAGTGNAASVVAPNRGTVACLGCARLFATRELLASHLSIPTAQRQPACAACACAGCGETFASQESHAAHRRQCDRMLLCPGCERRFSSAALLQAHATAPPRSCPVRMCCGCSAVFANTNVFEEHERSCKRVETCPSCRRRFSSKSMLASHLAKPLTARPLCTAASCRGCGQAFATEPEQAAHEDMCWRIFGCPGCDGRFTSVEEFQLHVREKLPQCSAAQCSLCGMVFGSTEECSGHQRQHDKSAGRLPFGRTSSGRPQPLAASTQDPTSGWLPPPTPHQFRPEDVQLAPEDAIRKIYMEVASLDGASLRARLRQLQLLWHPDRSRRSNIDEATACQVFSAIQGVWEMRVAGTK